MIKNIVFDMGNIITEYRPMDYIKVVTDDGDKQKRLFAAIFESPEWEKLDLGNITYPQATVIWIGRDPDLECEIRQIALHWHEHKTLIPAVNKLVLALKDNGYGVYLLSNVGEKFPLYRDKIPALRAMDGCILSFEHHVIKPDPAIYKLLFNTYSLNPATCFFIDDIAANVEAGRRLNMKGFVFPKNIPAEQAVFKLIAALNEEGVEIAYSDLNSYQCERTF